MMAGLESVAYWPWWLGALGLGGLSLLHLALTGKVLGVSGAWKRVVQWREAAAAAEAECALRTQTDALLADLDAATRAEFGAVNDASASASASPASGLENAPPLFASASAPAISPAASAVFLVMMAIGGAVSAAAAGRWGLQYDLGAVFG